MKYEQRKKIVDNAPEGAIECDVHQERYIMDWEERTGDLLSLYKEIVEKEERINELEQLAKGNL